MSSPAIISRNVLVEGDVPLLEVRLFGSGEVRVAGKPLPPLRTRKGFYLLVLLVLRAGREVTREFLATALWPDSLEERARSGLRRALTDLRQALGPAACLLESPAARTLRLATTGLVCDVLQFDTLAGRNDEAAIPLYQGQLLEGCDEEWAMPDREARREKYIALRISLAETQIRLGEHLAATGHLRAAVVADPLREASRRALMAALSTAGDHAAAIQSFRDLRSLLRREWNTEPGAETVTLFQSIRDCARRAARISAQPLAASTAITSAVLPVPPYPLPRPLTAILGREREQEEIRCLLATRRLITLTGIGGIGKTRLAVAVAQEILERDGEGISAYGIGFADLSGLSEGGSGGEHIARKLWDALGIETDASHGSAEAGLREALATRRVLLLLDNAEHLLDTLSPLVANLLSACPDIRVLVTSREPLGIPGEFLYTLSPLTVPEENTPSAAARYADAVRLFWERAEAIQPGFAHDAWQAEVALPAVVRICRRLDGLPLAIELAAARLTLFSVTEIANRLDQRFRLLTAGGRGIPERHRTLRATLDWSYRLLNDEEQNLLRRLSVFAGPFSVERACQLVNEIEAEWEALDLLDALARKSLLTRVPGEGEPRFRLLETVRQYAAERLREENETEDALLRFGDVYQHFVRDSYQKMKGPEQKETLETLDQEHDNLRAAMDWCFGPDASGNPVAVLHGLRLVNALCRYWGIRNQLTEGMHWCTRALEVATVAYAVEEDGRPALIHADVFNNAGNLARRQGDYDTAQSYQEASLELCRANDDLEGVAIALGNLSTIAHHRGDYAHALECYREGLAIQRERGDLGEVSMFLHNRGNLARQIGEFEEARILHEEGLVIRRQMGDKRNIAWSLIGVAQSLVDVGRNGVTRPGDDERVEAMLEESLRLMQEVGDREGIIHGLLALGVYRRERGELLKARALLTECIEAVSGMEGQRIVGSALDGAMRMAAALGEVDTAARLCGAIDAMVARLGVSLTPLDIADTENFVQLLRAKLGNQEFAVAYQRGQVLSLSEALCLASAALNVPDLLPSREFTGKP